MKTVKKLLSLMLVAMMLVSVMPFQASAAGFRAVLYVQDEDGTELCETSLENTEKVNLQSWAEETYEANNLPKGTLEIKEVTTTNSPTEESGEYTLTNNTAFTVKVKVTADKAPEVETYAVALYIHQDGKEVAKDYKYAVASGTELNIEEWAGKLWAETKILSYVDQKTGASLSGTVKIEKATAIVVNVDKSPEATTESTEATQPSTEATEPKTEYTIIFKYCGDEECHKCTTSLADCGNIVSKKVVTTNQALAEKDIPQAFERYGYVFSKWVNVADTNDDTPVGTYTGDATFEAVYTKSTSNTHRVAVYGVIYRNGETTVMSTPLAITYAKNKADLLTALNNLKSKIQNELDDMGKTVKNGYSWDGVTFYTDDDLDNDDRVATGDKITKDGAYYVEVKYTGNDKIQLYVHTSKSMTIKDTITLKTYTPGETITKSKIKTAVKNAGWSYSNIKTYGLQEWEKIVDEQTSSAADERTSFTVEHGETEIHVYLYSGSSSSSSNKSDNPKTGDTILMAVTVMGLSATALAALYFTNKKKAI